LIRNARLAWAPVAHHCARLVQHSSHDAPGSLAWSLGLGHLTDCELDGGGKPGRYTSYRRRDLALSVASATYALAVPPPPRAYALDASCILHPASSQETAVYPTRRPGRQGRRAFARAPWPRS